jgi:hypothetical protein
MTAPELPRRRPALPSDAPRVAELMRASVLELFPSSLLR